ncbi:MAG: Fe-S protein assembly co-chaperone HscB [Gammaproteobacteria bacterium]|nr:Fe-S protein assembly co-chaperone HscB [Gammaproteobacteria bacterium]
MHAGSSNNHFELFGLAVGFNVDHEALALRYRDLQKSVHPDRFVNASDQEHRLSMQQSALVNEAYRILKSPLERARYLLELNARPLDDSDTSMPTDFLLEQMELREAMESVHLATAPLDALTKIRNTLEEKERALVMELEGLFANISDASLQTATEVVRKMQFILRLLTETEEMEANLLHEI